MSFMQQEIFQGQAYIVETVWGGTEVVPADVVGIVESVTELRDYVNEEIDEDSELELKAGWLCRMSAPGYMDCTDWCLCETEQQCRDLLDDMYGDDE